jgi:hypothetical protein
MPTVTSINRKKRKKRERRKKEIREEVVPNGTL